MNSAGRPDAFGDLVAKAEPALRTICWSLRRTIASLHKDFHEVIWSRQRIASYGIGPKKMSEHYAYIALHSKHVNLGFYRGATLKNRAELLEGSGKKLRHVKIHDGASARNPAIAALLREAIAEQRRHASKGHARR